MTADMAIDTAAVPAEQVNVLRRADEPAHFLWRGRLYAVRAVRAHWFERHRPGQAVPAEPPIGSPTAPPADAAAAPAPVGRPGRAESPDDYDRELWRVEAAPGRMAPTGVFDLCLARPDGNWTLTTVPEHDQ